MTGKAHRFYAVEYTADPDTTTGEPNKRTSRMNIACKIAVFSSLTDRAEWVALGKRRGKNVVNAPERVLNRVLGGMNNADRKDYLLALEYKY